jgi:predicted alpha/beta superfamily hydrolase
MPKSSGLFLTLLATLAALAASPSSRLAAQASPSTTIASRDERFGIRSIVLGEDREIWVHLPVEAATGERFDVVYVLDAHATFPVTNGELDHRVVFQRPPRMVVVGITSRSSEGRGRDFTPTPDSGRRGWPGAGQADNFIRFLETEVFPTIEQRYPVTKRRTLIGHSLAGLFALHAFSTRPDLFEKYIAISPTIPWGRGAVLSTVTTRLGDLPEPRGLYVSVGNEGDGYQQGIDRLTQLLRNSAPATLRWKVEKYPNEDHSGVVSPSIHAGLAFLFDTRR